MTYLLASFLAERSQLTTFRGVMEACTCRVSRMRHSFGMEVRISFNKHSEEDRREG